MQDTGTIRPIFFDLPPTWGFSINNYNMGKSTRANRQAKADKQELKQCNRLLTVQEGVIHQYEEQLVAGDKELKFTNMLVASLLASLDEIATVSTDPITRQLAGMAKERCNVDKLIHARQLLDNP